MGGCFHEEEIGSEVWSIPDSSGDPTREIGNLVCYQMLCDHLPDETYRMDRKAPRNLLVWYKRVVFPRHGLPMTQGNRRSASPPRAQVNGKLDRLLMPFLGNWPDSESDPRPSRVDRVSAFKAKATLTRPRNNEKKECRGRGEFP